MYDSHDSEISTFFSQNLLTVKQLVLSAVFAMFIILCLKKKIRFSSYFALKDAKLLILGRKCIILKIAP